MKSGNGDNLPPPRDLQAMREIVPASGQMHQEFVLSCACCNDNRCLLNVIFRPMDTFVSFVCAICNCVAFRVEIAERETELAVVSPPSNVIHFKKFERQMSDPLNTPPKGSV